MAGIGVKVTGLAETRARILKLPAEVAADTRVIIERATRESAAQLRAAYPLGDTGKLRAGVTTEIIPTATGARGRVISSSPHAVYWEYGTVNRKTQKGWNRGRMASQIHRGLLAISARQRQIVRAAVTARLAKDFKVTGHAG